MPSVNGTGERWRQVVGWPQYEVSSHGRVYSKRNGLLLKPGVGSHGYEVVGLCRNGMQKTATIHRLVLRAFKGRPQKRRMDGCHKDGDQLNNRITNLRWGTRKSNCKDTLRHGTQWRPAGVKNWKAKLTERDVRYIRRHLEVGPSEMGRLFQVLPCTISNIRARRLWRHVR